MTERFICQAIQPAGDAFDTVRMAAGEPGLSPTFIWRNRTIEIERVLHSWRQTGKCRHGSSELYVRRHWFEVLATSGEILKIYFDRQPRKGVHAARWWLFSIRSPAPDG